MTYDEVFPPKYIRPDDIADRPRIATIETVAIESMYSRFTRQEVHRPVLYLKGWPRGVVMNKTMWQQIADAVDQQNTDDWAGNKIILFAEQTPRGLGIRARKAGNGA